VKWPTACLNKWVPYLRLAASAAALLALVFPGCNSVSRITKSSLSKTQLYAVSGESTAFFRHGPQPGHDPDSRLAKDTLVKLIRPSFGYSKIELVDSGEKGYVLNEQIKPAPPSLIAAATAVREDHVGPIGPQTFGSPRETFNLDSNDPRLIPPPEELPAPDLPPSTQ
jgi:hypothetical protein